MASRNTFAVTRKLRAGGWKNYRRRQLVTVTEDCVVRSSWWADEWRTSNPTARPWPRDRRLTSGADIESPGAISTGWLGDYVGGPLPSHAGQLSVVRPTADRRVRAGCRLSHYDGVEAGQSARNVKLWARPGSHVTERRHITATKRVKKRQTFLSKLIKTQNTRRKENTNSSTHCTCVKLVKKVG